MTRCVRCTAVGPVDRCGYCTDCATYDAKKSDSSIPYYWEELADEPQSISAYLGCDCPAWLVGKEAHASLLQ